MERYFEVAKSATPPSAPPASSGYPTNGNPATGTPATEPGEWWFHMITEEIRAVIANAGYTPDHTQLNQLLLAINALITAGVPNASQTVKGRIEIATDAEVAALTDVERAITPGGLGSVFAKSFGTSGYQKLPSGLIIQWGVVTTSAAADTVVNYPIAFPNAAKSVVGTVGAPTGHITFVTNTTTASLFYCNAFSAGGRNACSCSWIAIGY